MWKEVETREKGVWCSLPGQTRPTRVIESHPEQQCACRSGLPASQPCSSWPSVQMTSHSSSSSSRWGVVAWPLFRVLRECLNILVSRCRR